MGLDRTLRKVGHLAEKRGVRGIVVSRVYLSVVGYKDDEQPFRKRLTRRDLRETEGTVSGFF